MGQSELSNIENILVKVDNNNLMYIDPNSVVDSNGDVQPRGLKQENLMMYANLEADLIPRTTLISNEGGNTLVSVARGTLNFLRKQTGDKNFDTSWTEAFVGADVMDENGQYVGAEAQMYDDSGQTFGIDSISVQVKGANFTPQVTINFIDVRGKTLFESPNNSPYKAFFHMPWPIFYLTLKGYYGKAIRYKLHMSKFSSKFNDVNGNFEITCTFIGSTYAHLNDIPLSAVINAPYMFLTESTDDAKYNEKTGVYEKKVSKSSRGYNLLKSVYRQYKQKGLIPDDFPEAVTLMELGYKAESLDKVLEQVIYDEVVDMKVFSAIKEMDDSLSKFNSAVLGWSKINLSSSDTVTINDTLYYYLSAKDKTKPEIVNGSESKSLKSIIELWSEKITKNELLGNNVLKKAGADFEKTRLSVKKINSIETYYTIKDQKVLVAIDKLFGDIADIASSYSAQKTTIEDAVEKKMNEVIKDPSKGFGFEPTIRNMFAVLLANADVFIKLMKDTHDRAFESAELRKGLLSSLTTESVGDAIYPWPEVKKPTSNGKQNVVSYPGETDLIPKLQTNNRTLWPEVDFVENYVAVTTNRVETNPQVNPSENTVRYIFETDIDREKIDDISGIDVINSLIPYTDKSFSSFIYEVYERAKYITLFDSFNNNFLKKLADEEYDNIKECISEDADLVNIVKKIPNVDQLLEYMKGVSYYDRYPYFKDQLPTVGYLKNIIEDSYNFEKYGSSTRTENRELSEEFNGILTQYEAEDYRTNIYPFNSTEYLSYIDKESFSPDNFKFNGVLSINSKEGFVCSPIDSAAWVKDGYTNKTIFDQPLKVGDTNVNILNTPYFHNQLFEDFFKTGRYGKYKGSAYLLLNSLAFKDLEDNITFSGKTILMSSLFREISATHFIPYHLMLKWGSIYHRYKNYILNGDDILDSCLDSSFTTLTINGSVYFKYSSSGTQFDTVTLDGTTVTYTDGKDVGMHPFYHAVYSQIVNGYNHYDVTLGDTDFSAKVSDSHIRYSKRTSVKNVNYWSVYTDNSKYVPTDKTYTLLPSNGFQKTISNTDEFTFAEQYNVRSAWWQDDEVIKDELNGKTFNSPSQYQKSLNTTDRTLDNLYSLEGNYRKVIDLIGTFQPKVLEMFEEMFLDFASEKTNDETTFKRFNGLSYDNFQDVLKDISVIDHLPEDDGTNTPTLIEYIKNRQYQSIIDIQTEILSTNNLIKFTLSNPKEIDSYVYSGLAKLDNLNTYNPADYNSIQLTQDNLNYIKLYIGEDLNGYYQQFFSVNNIELSEDNILRHRSVAQIFAGYIENGGSFSNTSFSDYLRTNVFQRTTNGYDDGSPAGGADNRLQTFLGYLLPKISSGNGIQKKTETTAIRAQNGHNMDPLKLEIYNTFKVFNDKWTAGNSIGQNLLLEDFLFFDKANRDIGDKFYLNIDKVLPLLDSKNSKQSLFGAISMLTQNTGLDVRALPTYVNFYGNNVTNKTRIEPSKKVASNIFGTFLEVDYQESTPKVIVQLVGASSSRPDLSFSKDYKFTDDGFDISSVNNNPVVVTSLESFTVNDLSKSNRVVAFEVSFGDQNQGIFKGLQLDQSSLKNTSEGFVVLENLARSESGAGTYNTDVSLFDYYKQASYKCTVSCMGNVMIQPTMYFYLKNVPIFKGSYWITEVTHSIRNNNIETHFTGARIPYSSLPDPKESFTASYRVLFDKISSRAVAKLKQNQVSGTTTQEVVKTSDGTYTTDRRNVLIQGETIVQETGITEFGVPYNGYGNDTNIQKVSLNGSQTLRAIVIQMGGPNYPISDDTTMGIISQLENTPTLKWSEIKSSNTYFYSTKFQLDSTHTASKVITAKTNFFNPKNGKTALLNPNYTLTAPKSVHGPVSIGPSVTGYGMGMSYELMKYLGLNDGDVVYFNMF